MNTGPARSASVAAPLVGAPTVGASIAQAAPVPADKPTTAAPPAANRFAELLRRTRAETAKQEAPAPTHSPRTESVDEEDWRSLP